MSENNDNVKFEHNQRIGDAYFASGAITVSVKDAIVWICELNGDYLIAEYGENLPQVSIAAGTPIRKLGQKSYIVG